MIFSHNGEQLVGKLTSIIDKGNDDAGDYLRAKAKAEEIVELFEGVVGELIESALEKFKDYAIENDIKLEIRDLDRRLDRMKDEVHSLDSSLDSAKDDIRDIEYKLNK